MKKIFITGATGFVGGRLAEVALSENLEIVALVRDWSRAARLARLPVQMVQGNILNYGSLCNAMQGCDTVFHCAVDNRSWGDLHRRTSAEGTENVLKAALECGVKQLVHLSSAAVFGYDSSPGITEESPVSYSNDDYCDGKIASEKAALQFHQETGLPVVVLRPTLVYGPFGDYSAGIIKMLRNGKATVVAGGHGNCNALYIDNLIAAMFLAAKNEKAAGQVLHISDAEPILWRDYLEGHALAIDGIELPLPEKTLAEMNSLIVAAGNEKVSTFGQIFKLIRDPNTHTALYSIPIVRKSVEFTKKAAATVLTESARAAVRRIIVSQNNITGSADTVPEKSLSFEKWEVSMLTAFQNTKFSIEKARRVLGYHPTIDFEEGMKRTAAWIKWARL